MIRRKGRCLCFAGLAALVTLFSACICGVSIVMLFASDKGTGSTVLVALMFGTAAIAAGKSARGCFRAGLIVSPSGLVVRGPWSTCSFSPSAIDRFEAGLQDYGGRGNPTAGVTLRLKDGTVVPIWALVAEGFIWNYEDDVRSWRSTVDELNSLLERLARDRLVGPREAGRS